MDPEYGLFRDAVLAVFHRKKTAFLTTATILKEIHFQKEIFPKEDKERLDSILEQMRTEDLVLTNQPKFAALTEKGKEAVVCMEEERLKTLEEEMKRRSG